MQSFEDSNLLTFVAADLRDARDELDVGTPKRIMAVEIRWHW
jgi:hypothetical protein